MLKLLRSVIERCQLSIRIDPSTWQASAEGPLAVIALVVIILALFYHGS